MTECSKSQKTQMELESVKRLLEKEGGPYESTVVDSLAHRFFEPFVVQGLKVDLIERGRIVCSLVVPPRLLNTGNSLHGGATATLVDLVGSAVIFTMGAPMTGVSVEINVSYLDGAYVGVSVIYLAGDLPNILLGSKFERNSSSDDLGACRCWGEEIDIDPKALLVGKVIGVVNVEVRKKKTGKFIARGRHTMYMAVPSKL